MGHRLCPLSDGNLDLSPRYGATRESGGVVPRHGRAAYKNLDDKEEGGRRIAVAWTTTLPLAKVHRSNNILNSNKKIPVMGAVPYRGLE